LDAKIDKLLDNGQPTNILMNLFIVPFICHQTFVISYDLTIIDYPGEGLLRISVYIIATESALLCWDLSKTLTSMQKYVLVQGSIWQKLAFTFAAYSNEIISLFTVIWCNKTNYDWIWINLLMVKMISQLALKRFYPCWTRGKCDLPTWEFFLANKQIKPYSEYT
jgi:hypothetical protein